MKRFIVLILAGFLLLTGAGYSEAMSYILHPRELILRDYHTGAEVPRTITMRGGQTRMFRLEVRHFDTRGWEAFDIYPSNTIAEIELTYTLPLSSMTLQVDHSTWISSVRHVDHDAFATPPPSEFRTIYRAITVTARSNPGSATIDIPLAWHLEYRLTRIGGAVQIRPLPTTSVVVRVHPGADDGGSGCNAASLGFLTLLLLPLASLFFIRKRRQ